MPPPCAARLRLLEAEENSARVRDASLRERLLCAEDLYRSALSSAAARRYADALAAYQSALSSALEQAEAPPSVSLQPIAAVFAQASIQQGPQEEASRQQQQRQNNQLQQEREARSAVHVRLSAEAASQATAAEDAQLLARARSEASSRVSAAEHAEREAHACAEAAEIERVQHEEQGRASAHGAEERKREQQRIEQEAEAAAAAAAAVQVDAGAEKLEAVVSPAPLAPAPAFRRSAFPEEALLLSDDSEVHSEGFALDGLDSLEIGEDCPASGLGAEAPMAPPSVAPKPAPASPSPPPKPQQPTLEDNCFGERPKDPFLAAAWVAAQKRASGAAAAMLQHGGRHGGGSGVKGEALQSQQHPQQPFPSGSTFEGGLKALPASLSILSSPPPKLSHQASLEPSPPALLRAAGDTGTISLTDLAAEGAEGVQHALCVEWGGGGEGEGGMGVGLDGFAWPEGVVGLGNLSGSGLGFSFGTMGSLSTSRALPVRPRSIASLGTRPTPMGLRAQHAAALGALNLGDSDEEVEGGGPGGRAEGSASFATAPGKSGQRQEADALPSALKALPYLGPSQADFPESPDSPASPNLEELEASAFGVGWGGSSRGSAQQHSSARNPPFARTAPQVQVGSFRGGGSRVNMSSDEVDVDLL